MNANILLSLGLLLIFIQSIGLLLLWKKQRKLQGLNHNSYRAGNLALTKKQLYREIERHEETEISLKETQVYLQALLDSMPSILIGVAVDGTVTHWNKSAEAATGLTLASVYGNLLGTVYPSLPVSQQMILDTLRTGEAQYKKNIQQGVGSNARYTDIVVYPLVISEEVEEAVVMATDVSQRVHIENRLLQNEKMQGLGEMAAGLAHEINNPLAGILHHVQNIKRRTSAELQANRDCAEALNVNIDTVHQYLHQRNVLSFIDNIQIAGERASHIVNNMLNFARTSYVTHVKTDLQELINYAIELTENSFTQGETTSTAYPNIILNIDKNLPQIECAAIEIQQVLVNLLRNAVQAFDADAMDINKTPEIRIEARQSNTEVVLSIADNGPGMEEDVRAHIFEPFFTTKQLNQGTGLGLSVCYFIISEHHNGEIDVESRPGSGSRFTLRLPALQTRSETEAIN